jgi:c(7)-type cytochrome triheme protein
LRPANPEKGPVSSPIKSVLLALALLPALAAPDSSQDTVVKKRRPLPYEYGRIVLNSYSGKSALAPVVFDHWRHRAKFTCRVCHVDIGFAMKTGATGINASDNMRGYYCGACHNGKSIFDGKTLFAACSRTLSDEDRPQCERCHSYGRDSSGDSDFLRFAQALPKERFGNGLDWQQAEELGMIHPLDFVNGISIKRKSLTIQQDFALNPKLQSMPDIIFSHKKHTVWNGCELCHPEIFVGVKRGTTRYSMVGIFEGKYCGVCHNTVAFPLTDCQRCHSKPMQPEKG